MEAANELKAAGNGLFAKKEWSAAAEKYSAAIAAWIEWKGQQKGAEEEADEAEREQAAQAAQEWAGQAAVYYKNRAACSIQLESYADAVSDCSAALELCPGDVKATYRRAEAYEKMGELSMAFEDLMELQKRQPDNKTFQKALKRIMERQKKQQSKASSENLSVQMLQIIEDREANAEKRTAAARNLAVLAQTPGKVEWILQAKGVDRMKAVFEMEETELEVRLALLQAFRIASKHQNTADAVYTAISLEFLTQHALSKEPRIAASVFRILEQLADRMLVLYEAERTRRYNKKIKTSQPELPVKKVQMVVACVYKALSGCTEETPAEPLAAALGVVIEGARCFQIANSFMDSGFIRLLLEVCSVRRDDLVKSKATVAISNVYEFVGSKREEEFRTSCKHTLMAMLDREEEERMPALFALSVILQAIPAVGDFLVEEPTALEKVIELAKQAKGEEQERVVVDAILETAANRKIGGAVLAAGFGEVKRFYKSKYDTVRVRALVCLSKVGVAGDSKEGRGMSGESYVNLSKSARKFLGEGCSGRPDSVKANISDPKVLAEIRGYAVEALAYLSCEAEVKEELAADDLALKGLHDTALLDNRVLRISIVTIYQNMARAFAKPTEKQEELAKLHKMAGQEVPGMVLHPMDEPEFVKKRIAVLVKAGACAALSSLSKVKSEATAEIVSRIYLAFAEADVKHRGIIIQQGGARALIRLSRFGTAEGKEAAQHALAKCAIVLDPNVAFPGQVGVDCIGPLSTLTTSESALATFEATMALTNLVSAGDDTRMEVIRHPRALSDIEMVQIEDDPRLRQAGTECLMNMFQCETYFSYYEDGGRCRARIPIWVAFCGEEEPGLARAAAGGLAMMSQIPSVCDVIVKEKHGLTILKEIAACNDAALQHRALCVISNIIASSKENAKAWFDSENSVELLTALYQLTDTPKPVKDLVTGALAKLMDYGLVQKNL
mmetsp:Transcript_19962/g.76476  ORF Transcript_19962/g.76476 Transcript_19962/m.76476 type:complete len:959 (+) Transcript_19962:85-2961(+)